MAAQPTSEKMKLIGQRIDEIRKARKWSIKRLAEGIGTKSYGTIKHHLDTGKMDTDWLIRYASALGCSTEELVADTVDLTKFELTDDIVSYYPYNLIIAVLGGNSPDARQIMYKAYIPAFMESLDTLTDREKKVLEMRFKCKLTLKETGPYFGVTQERIREIEAKALRKLRNPSRCRHWQFDTMEMYFEAKKEASDLELENIILRDNLRRLNVPEEKMLERHEEEIDTRTELWEAELSVRSYNCLSRAGIRYISDLKDWTLEDLSKVRNLGRKSLNEVVHVMKEKYGIEIKSATEERRL